MTHHDRERVARAIMKARTPEGSVYIGTRGVIAEAKDNPHCAVALRQADAAIAAMSPSWQPISTAPTNGCVLILWTGVRIAIGAHAQHKIQQAPWRETHSLGAVLHPQPKHWMPLPEPPTRTGSEANG